MWPGPVHPRPRALPPRSRQAVTTSVPSNHPCPVPGSLSITEAQYTPPLTGLLTVTLALILGPRGDNKQNSALPTRHMQLANAPPFPRARIYRPRFRAVVTVGGCAVVAVLRASTQTTGGTGVRRHLASARPGPPARWVHLASGCGPTRHCVLLGACSDAAHGRSGHGAPQPEEASHSGARHSNSGRSHLYLVGKDQNWELGGRGLSCAQRRRS